MYIQQENVNAKVFIRASAKLAAIKTIFFFLIINLISDVGRAPLDITIYFNHLFTKYSFTKILTLIKVARRETNKY